MTCCLRQVEHCDNKDKEGGRRGGREEPFTTSDKKQLTCLWWATNCYNNRYILGYETIAWWYILGHNPSSTVGVSVRNLPTRKIVQLEKVYLNRWKMKLKESRLLKVNALLYLTEHSINQNQQTMQMQMFCWCCNN